MCQINRAYVISKPLLILSLKTKYFLSDGLCVVAAADCSAKRDEDDAPACPDEMPIQCDGKYIFYFFIYVPK